MNGTHRFSGRLPLLIVRGSRPRVRSAWQQFFRAHDDTDMLPSLTEVHLSTFQWPVTEYAYVAHRFSALTLRC